MRIGLGAIALVALLALAGCGGSEEPPAASTPVAKPAAEAPAPTPAPPPASAPEPAAAAARAGDAAAGEVLYVQYCASCHGARGAGDGPVGASLDPKPVAHSDGAYMNALSQEHLFKVIKLGGPAVGKSALMAPWGGSLSDAQIWDVIAFVRSLADPPYQP